MMKQELDLRLTHAGESLWDTFSGRERPFSLDNNDVQLHLFCSIPNTVVWPTCKVPLLALMGDWTDRPKLLTLDTEGLVRGDLGSGDVVGKGHRGIQIPTHTRL